MGCTLSKWCTQKTPEPEEQHECCGQSHTITTSKIYWSYDSDSSDSEVTGVVTNTTHVGVDQGVARVEPLPTRCHCRHDTTHRASLKKDGGEAGSARRSSSSSITEKRERQRSTRSVSVSVDSRTRQEVCLKQVRIDEEKEETATQEKQLTNSS